MTKQVAFGMQLPVQSQSTLFVQAWEPGAGAAEMVRVTQACETAGFAYVAVCDHVAIPRPQAETMSTSWWDTIATLSYLAAVTDRIGLLSHVYVLPYRHPLVAAKAWATLDALSDGRAILGVGAGHVAAEFAALEVSFDDRGRLLDEAIDAVRAALADEYPTHAGARWSFEELGQRPRPTQPAVPIWVGGSSRSAMRRAAERGDGWLPQGPPKDGMAAGIDYIRATRAASARADDPIVLGALSGPLYVGEPSWDTGRCVRGPAEKVAAYLRTYRDLGVDQIQVGFASRSVDELCDQIAAYAVDVAPLVNS
ncbi:MAG: TIGR03619 family F420-dependent LLM class oxidoreductase [Acidimicrobiales bacterium]